jgi:hypothetical protein
MWPGALRHCAPTASSRMSGGNASQVHWSAVHVPKHSPRVRRHSKCDSVHVDIRLVYIRLVSTRRHAGVLSNDPFDLALLIKAADTGFPFSIP